MAYSEAVHFAQTWGLVYLTLIFAAGCAYALWPSNRKRFDKAARMILSDEPPILRETSHE